VPKKLLKREERKGKGKGKGKERALVDWLTLLYLLVSLLYVVTATLSGKLVKVAISNEEVPSLTPGRSYFCRSAPTLIAPKMLGMNDALSYNNVLELER
jgi:hypothetical protein